MKLDLDCMRDVLIEMERCGLNQRLPFRNLQRALSQYPPDVLQYACAKLYEGGLIDAVAVHADGLCAPYIAELIDISMPGHQFLAKIRDEERFAKTKAVASTLRDFSLSAISSIAEGISSAAINAYFSKANS